MDALCQVMITNHIADLKVFIGNQVVRRDKRVCLLSGEIAHAAFEPSNSPLPVPFWPSCGFLAPLFLSRKLAMQAFEFLFRFAIVAWVLNGVAFGNRLGKP